MSGDHSELSQFIVGKKVRYIPYKAFGDIQHPDCEDGIITSTNDTHVFVRFGNNTTSQACHPDKLYMFV